MGDLFTVISPILGQLGFGAVIVWLMLKREEAHKEEMHRKDELLKLKDDRMNQVVDKMTDAYKENSAVQTGVKDVLDDLRNTVTENTEATRSSSAVNDKLVSTIDFFIRNSRSSN